MEDARRGRDYGLCDSCYRLAFDRLRWKDFERLKVIAKEFMSIRGNLRRVKDRLQAMRIITFNSAMKDVLRVLLKLDDKDISFLREVYCEYKTSPQSFDYVGVDRLGYEKYLIDVTSTISNSVAGLSSKEKEGARKAKELGLKCL